MEKLKCHHLLNFKPEKFIKNFDSFPELPANKKFFVGVHDPILFLHTDVYEKLSRLGKLTSLVFEMVPGADKGNIHIDMESSSLQPYWPSLNIILNGQGTMKWFNPIKKGIVLNNSSADVMYKAWFNNYGEPIDEWATGKVALVRTDIAHQAWNYDNVNRKIVSIRWKNRISWEETIEWFEENFPV